MRETLRASFLVVACAVALGACGQVKIEEEPAGGTPVPSTRVAPTTATTVLQPATTAAPFAPGSDSRSSWPTTSAPATIGGRTCLAIVTDGLTLARDYSQEQRGIAGADEAKYKARAQVLADEARSEGCQVPPVIENFLS